MTQTLNDMQGFGSVKNEKTLVSIGPNTQDVNTTYLTTSIPNDSGLESDINTQAVEHPSLPLSGFVTRDEHTSQPVKALKGLNCKNILIVNETTRTKHTQGYESISEIGFNERISFEDAIPEGLTIEVPEEALQKIRIFQPISDDIITTTSTDNSEEKIRDNEPSDSKANLLKILLQNQTKRDSVRQVKEAKKISNIALKTPKRVTPPKKKTESWRLSLEELGKKEDVIFEFKNQKIEDSYKFFYETSKKELKACMQKLAEAANGSKIGKAEILKYDDGRSIRLNKADRVVYDIGRSLSGKKRVIIMSIGGHYSKS